MSLNRELRRKQNKQLKNQFPIKKLTPDHRNLVKQLEEGLIAKGHLQGLDEAQQIFRQRLFENVPKIKGVGPHLFKEIVKALGVTDLQGDEKDAATKNRL